MHGTTEVITLFSPQRPFILENGYKFHGLEVACQTHGKLNSTGDNAVLICHALTGDAHVAGTADYSTALLRKAPRLNAMKQGQPGWWDGLIGAGKTIDPARFFVVCSNILGSCYGTTGPSSINPANGQPYGTAFPDFTVRDMVRLQYELLKQLGIKKLVTVSGGSLGGMQVLEWALLYPEMVGSIIPIATASRHSDWCIAINHLARAAITNDVAWAHGAYEEQPRRGLSLARQIAMVSYRSDLIFNQRFRRERFAPQTAGLTGKQFQAESYLEYQGNKLVNRFDANSYLYISRAMDGHDVAHARGKNAADVLGKIAAPALCIGIDSDILYPAHEQRGIAAAIPGAEYREINSVFGHDAFLVEFEQLDNIISPFLYKITG